MAKKSICLTSTAYETTNNGSTSEGDIWKHAYVSNLNGLKMTIRRGKLAIKSPAYIEFSDDLKIAIHRVRK